MPNIKLNKWDTGLVTSVDPNDLKPEIPVDSDHIRFERGYFKFEDLGLSEHQLPDLEFENGVTGWEWETGMFCLLTTDILSEDLEGDERQVLVLIAKKKIGDVYYRQVWFQENLTGEWYTTTNDSPRCYDVTTLKIKASFLATELEGKVKLILSGGVLRIYMPHDCFWFGLMDRTVRIDEGVLVTVNGYYFDRLSEPSSLSISTLDTDVADELSSNQRLGIDFTAEPILKAAAEAVTEYMKFKSTYEFVVWNEGTPTEMQGIKIEAVDLDKNIREYNPLVNDFPAGGEDHFWFFRMREADGSAWTNYYLIPSELESFYTPDGGWLSVYGGTLGTPPVKFNGGRLDWYVPLGTGYEYYYLGTLAQITNAKWGKSGTRTVDAFPDSYEFAHTVITFTLDDTTEIIAKLAKIDLSGISGEWAFKFNCTIPSDINKRITKLKFYIKLEDEIDFQLYKEINLIGEDDITLSNVIIDLGDATGIYLTQNIGFALDYDKPEQYKVLTAFKDILFERGYGIAISQYNNVNAYYSAVGGGKVQQDLFYETNMIELPGVAFARALIPGSGKVGVATDKATTMILISEVDGVPVFETTDSMPFGVTDFEDVLEIQGGGLILGKENIYFTDGRSQEPIGINIEDKIKGKTTDARIFYNPSLKEVYFIPTSSLIIYRYRLDRQVWERFDLSGAGTLAKVMQDFNGYLSVLTDSKLYRKDGSGAVLTAGQSYLRMNKTDLGEAGIDKNIDWVVADYEGQGEIKFVYDSSNVTLALPDEASRTEKDMWMPMKFRKPFTKMEVYIYPKSSDFIFYGLEIEFSTMRMRFNG